MSGSVPPLRESILSTYSSVSNESVWLDVWLDVLKRKKNFCRNSTKKKFSMVIPPPNVTGKLHLGHALNIALQDIVARQRVMSGYDVLWVPGTDHGGIATQMIVKKDILKTRHSSEPISKQEYLDATWKWYEKYGQEIVHQIKQMGAVLDWEYFSFTMDEQHSKVVQKSFIDLFNQKKIYRGKRMINWCVSCKTALSDHEIEYVSRKSKLYYIRYPILSGYKDGWQGIPLIIATTRPETILGDMAVAVNPDDPRYKKIIGWWVQVPLMDQEVRVVADSVVDISFGTGVLKVTPSHDAVDFEIGKRHNLDSNQVIGYDGKMNSNAGKYANLSRDVAHERIIEDLKQEDAIEKIECYTHSVAVCYRCSSVIEPFESEQWFLGMKEISQKTIAAQNQPDAIRFVPSNWENIYIAWLKSLKDWCISRQIQWGHQIPIYYCISSDKKIEEELYHPSRHTQCPFIVSDVPPTQCPYCKNTHLEQDPDVLDTWFSSGLWPISMICHTKKANIDTFYPTALLVTGHEILYLWVARMSMMGLLFKQKLPFRQVLMHGIIRDKQGKKMSKSLGNVIDPIDIMQKYGTDVLRLSLISQNLPNRDICMVDSTFITYRNFLNKIWNASRFILLHDQNFTSQDRDVLFQTQKNVPFDLFDCWIISHLSQLLIQVDKNFENYLFAHTIKLIYHFIWNEFCDWYIEICKIRLLDENFQGDKKNTLSILKMVLDVWVHVVHPYAPFISEQIWEQLQKRYTNHKISLSLLDSQLPNIPFIEDENIDQRVQWLLSIVSLIRTARSELHIDPKIQLDLSIQLFQEEYVYLIKSYKNYLLHLTKLKTLKICVQRPSWKNIVILGDNFEIYIATDSFSNIEQQMQLLQKNICSVEKQIERLDKKLNNENFLACAPKSEIQKTQIEKQEYGDKLHRYKLYLKNF